MTIENYLQSGAAARDVADVISSNMPKGPWLIEKDGPWDVIRFGQHRVYFREEGGWTVTDRGEAAQTLFQSPTQGQIDAIMEPLGKLVGDDRWEDGVIIVEDVGTVDLAEAVCAVMFASYRVWMRAWHLEPQP